MTPTTPRASARINRSPSPDSLLCASTSSYPFSHHRLTTILSTNLYALGNPHHHAAMPDLPRLDSAPAEIITMILDFLVPPPPEIGEERPVADNQLASDTPWFDFIQSRRDLCSICRVSPRLSDFARPLLYRDVTIWHEAAMHLFFQTLLDKPEYGLWTRYFACHITLTVPSVIQKFHDLFHPVPSIRALITPDPDSPQRLLYEVLVRLLKVKTVLLQVPVTDKHRNYGALCDEIQVTRAKYKDPHASPFQHINTLLLEGDPDPDPLPDIDDQWGAQPHYYWPLLTGFPKLDTLEVSSDLGLWNHNTLPPPFMSNIRHIYLYNSNAYPRDLHDLLLNAPMLETLYMVPRDANSVDEFFDDNTDDDNTYDADPKALNVALADHAKHLQVLSMRWDGVEFSKSHIGPDGRLASLAKMQSLRILSVQMALLHGKPSAVLEMPLIDLLPPNLVELTLEDWWWANVELFDELPDWGAQERADYYQTQHDYRVSVVRAVMDFARDVRRRLHKLEKVVFLCTIPWAWVPEEATPLESNFKDVKTTFLDQGVEFSVESGVEE